MGSILWFSKIPLMKIFDDHPNIEWMRVYDIGHFIQREVACRIVDAFSHYCVKVHQSQNWRTQVSCELELECPIVTLTDRHNPVQKPRKNAANL